MNGELLVIGGPTASGKSALAAALAEKLNGTVINADSMQIYRGLPILTAQPGIAELALAPHVLYGALGLDERCSAGRWLAMAEAAIQATRAAGRFPIVVGGTGLYLRALLQGLADIPPVPDDVRARVQARLAEIGPAAFHAEFAARDPAMAARLRPNDRQRLSRAAEVLEATGRSLAEWQEAPVAIPVRAACTVLVLPPRDALYAACDARFAAMVEEGALDEAREVMGYFPGGALPDDLPALKALGLRELVAHLRGETALKAAVAAAQTATRHYAKRQTTWFKGQFVSEKTITEKLNKHNLADSVKIIIQKLLTPSG